MKTKICGIRYLDNLKEILPLQPNFLGFIFYDKSPRFMANDLSPADLVHIPDGITKTGVFVNQSVDEVNDIVRSFGLQAVQLHGDESVEYISRLQNEISSKIIIIKAFGIDTNFDWAILTDYQDCCDYFLFDTKTINYGGSGDRFDHELLLNYHLKLPVFISGGIGVDEVDEVLNLKLNSICVVDMNSKLESGPGIKNIELVKSAIEKIRKYEREENI